METTTPSPEEMDLAQQIEADIKRLEKVTAATNDHRQKVVTKLSSALDLLSFDNINDAKASEIEAKSNLISTLLRALNDTDESHVKVLKVKKTVKSDQENEDTLKHISRTVAEFAKKIGNAGSIMKSQGEGGIDQADEMLDAAVSAANIKVSEGELESSNSTIQDVDVDLEESTS